MRAVQVSENAVSIWFSQEELPSRRQMLTLVRRVLSDSGLAPWPETETDCFSAGHEALLIARPGRPHRRTFFFGDLELLLGGVLPCPDGDSSLYAADGGGYLLSAAADVVRPALYEFGTETELSLEQETQLAERGARITAGGAVAELRRCFACEDDV